MRFRDILMAAATQSVGWTPSALGASLLAWWDAERSDLITESGGAVSSWRDIIGGYDAAQATSGSRPVYSATSFNGRPGVTFDGTDDYLEIVPTPAAVPIGSSSFEIWAAVQQDSLPADTGTRVILSWGGNTNAIWLARAVSGGVNRARAVAVISSAQNNADNATVDFSGRHVLRLRFTATSLQMDVDGVEGTPVVIASPVIPNTRLRIGANAAGTAAGFIVGTVSRGAITNPLSASQAFLMYSYFGAGV